MRVVAGSHRGRRLVAPPGSAVRPTSDRAREAVFNTLFSLVDLVDATVIDLFAGSGALGIEALSRGAARATFVDTDRHARAAIDTNLATLGLADQATVISGDALAWTARRGGGVDADVVFADPPYRFDQWDELLTGLGAGAVDVAVLESDREIAPPAGWRVLKVKRYGGTVVTFCRGDRLPGADGDTPHDPTALTDHAAQEGDTE